MNHEKYDQRIDFVKSIFKLNNLEITTVEPVEYDIKCPFPYNNFIYFVTFASPTASAKSIISSKSDDKTKPGTSQLPAGTSSVIIRLSNDHPGTDLNDTNRVENEVAIMTLVRQALAHSDYSHLCPDIYTWASMSTGQGFTMLQRMPGTMLEKKFEEMALDDRKNVLKQMADILALIQKFKLPETVKSIGGLTFDEDNHVISAQMTLYKGEPCADYLEFMRAMFRNKLAEVDENPVIEGWKANGVRARLDEFIKSGLPEILKDLQNVRKVIVHSDFTTNNFLFDASTFRATALLDFDFSHIATTADEFMGFSLTDISGGKLPGPYSDASSLSLRKYMLSGFPDPLPASTEDCEVQWEVAKAWDEKMTRSGAAKPSTIPHFEKIADFYWLLDNLCPFVLGSEVMRKRRTEEQLAAARQERERLLARFLDDAGF